MNILNGWSRWRSPVFLPWSGLFLLHQCPSACSSKIDWPCTWFANARRSRVFPTPGDTIALTTRLRDPGTCGYASEGSQYVLLRVVCHVLWAERTMATIYDNQSAAARRGSFVN